MLGSYSRSKGNPYEPIEPHRLSIAAVIISDQWYLADCSPAGPLPGGVRQLEPHSNNKETQLSHTRCTLSMPLKALGRCLCPFTMFQPDSLPSLNWERDTSGASTETVVAASQRRCIHPFGPAHSDLRHCASCCVHVASSL